MSNATVLTLPPGQLYSLETFALPPFNFRSGKAGTMQISFADGPLIIKDDKGKVIFTWTRGQNSNPGARDRVSIEDTPDDTTVVKFTTENVDQVNKEGAGDGPSSQEVTSGATGDSPEQASNNSSGPTLLEIGSLHADINEGARTGGVDIVGDPSTPYQRPEGSPVEPSSPFSVNKRIETQIGVFKRRSDSPSKSEIPNKRQAVSSSSEGASHATTSDASRDENVNGQVDVPASSHGSQGNGQDGRSSIRGDGTGSGDANANTGHIVVDGIDSVRVNGNVLSVTVSGAADLVVDGNVEQGIIVSGTGDVTVFGNVWGGISASGAGEVYVAGDVYGNIIVSGMASVIVQGRHQSGGVYRSGLADIQIKNRDHNY